MDNGTYQWAVPQKHPTLDKWAVPLPPESVTVPEGVEVVEALPDDWNLPTEIKE